MQWKVKLDLIINLVQTVPIRMSNSFKQFSNVASHNDENFFVSETCVRGDFLIYQKSIALDGQENEGYDFGYVYRGVACAMIMYKRFDLLVDYPQDQVSFAESPLTMLSFGILPIKTIYCYRHFKRMGIPNVTVGLSDLNG